MTAAADERASGRIEDGQLDSKALGVPKRFRVWLPPGYDGRARFPVVYLLHGAQGDERRWELYGHAPEIARSVGLPAILVMPDADTGFYANWVTHWDYGDCVQKRGPQDCARRQRYEDFIVQDLVGHVDATYRTIPERGGRALAGNSMGGYGALALAMRHPDVFSAAASHSGIDALLYLGPHPFRPGKALLAKSVEALAHRPVSRQLVKIFGAELSTWRAHDPAWLAAKLPPGTLALYLDCGDHDEYGLQDQAAYLHEVLEAHGVPHIFAIAPGGHDWSFWKERLVESFRFLKTRLPPPR